MLMPIVSHGFPGISWAFFSLGCVCWNWAVFIDFSILSLMFIYYVDSQTCRHVFSIWFSCGCCVAGLKSVTEGKWVLIFFYLSAYICLLLTDCHRMSSMVACLYLPLPMSVVACHLLCMLSAPEDGHHFGFCLMFHMLTCIPVCSCMFLWHWFSA